MGKKVSIKKGIALWNKAKRLIPGGSQLLSKRAEMFLPGGWPAYYKKAKGIEITDLDNRTHLDFSLMGVGACALGYADDSVDRKVVEAVRRGSMSTLNCPEEVELATLLLKIHPWAGMCRFARTGGEAMAIAIRIARAKSVKDGVAVCGYHGWSDWYLSANLGSTKALDEHLLPGLAPVGVPRALTGSVAAFSYNDLEALKDISAKRKDIGVIVVETMRHELPKKNFLHEVKRIARRIGAVLIFDEISIGWRVTLGGAHLAFGVSPDIAVFAKAMSNGYPMAAVIGTASVMRSAERSFISSTYWTERVGPVAALETIRKMRRVNLPAHLKRIGGMIADGWEKRAAAHRLHIKVIRTPEALVMFSFDYGGLNQALNTLFTQEMLKRGFLASLSVYVSYAHKKPHVDKYLAAVGAVFKLLAQAIRHGRVKKLLKGPVAHQGFKRLTK